MVTNFNTRPLQQNVALAAALLTMAPLSTQAASLANCFNSAPAYNASYTRELTVDENTSGKKLIVPGHLVGEGPEIEASCACPPTMSASTDVLLLSLAGSPLPAGVAGFGYLTSKVDVDVAGYINAVDSPDGGGLDKIEINSYPTTQFLYAKEAAKSQEARASVCSDATRPAGGTPIKRKFKWNVIAATFYIKQPILGEEVIPSTLVVQNYACLSTGSHCDRSDPNVRQVSNIWLGGKLTAPLSCTINAGSTIEVDFGNIISKQFRTPGEPPAAYALKNVDISYHCDGPAVGNDDKIKLTLIADQGTAEGSNQLIARMLGRDDIGVRVYNENSAAVALDGTFAFPVTLDEQGNGVVRIKAAPVSTQQESPAAGKFEGNVTVKMDLR